jgi:hypothetical protein
MTRQLSLIEVRPTWRLDDATREAGRRGVAEARAALQAARAAHQPDRGRQEHPTHNRSAA